MYTAFRILQFFQYQWKAQSKYYLHSPFVYSFYLNILEHSSFSTLQPLLVLRKQLSKSSTSFAVTDFGTGQPRHTGVAYIEKHVAIRHKYGKLLYALVQHFKPTVVLELGTSIGLSSAYMALGNPAASIATLEGDPALAQQARNTHRALWVKNVQVVEGNFAETLPNTLQNLPVVDLVFFDGNHTTEATLQYFNQCLPKAGEQSVFVFDDIYWSPGMKQAWQAIKQHPQVTLTIDVFQFGICFFSKQKLAKEDFILRY